MRLENVIDSLTSLDENELNEVLLESTKTVFILIHTMRKYGVDNLGIMIWLFMAAVFSADGDLTEKEIDCLEFLSKSYNKILRTFSRNEWRQKYNRFVSEHNDVDKIIKNQLLKFIKQLIDDGAVEVKLGKDKYYRDIVNFFTALALTDGRLNQKEEDFLKNILEEFLEE